MRVEDAHGAPPSIPFWLGEAPGRSDELSHGVSRLREEVAAQLAARAAPTAAVAWLARDVGPRRRRRRASCVDYLARAHAALGTLPTQQRIVLERFFDESGGTQLVIHSPFGSRINRAWGLALRKRFCRKFNFELQAAATEDAIVLSLSTSHSFPLDEVARYLHSATALDVLVQALLDAPLFGVRWRWNATTALALPRFRGGRKVAPQLQRMQSEDLLADASSRTRSPAPRTSSASARSPTIRWSRRRCTTACTRRWMPTAGCGCCAAWRAAEVEIVARDLPAPSPLAAEALNARPYAFLDDAPLEERRTQAVQNRRYADPQSADDLGRLDADAIDAVREEAWPQPRNADEMHEALSGLGVGQRRGSGRATRTGARLAAASSPTAGRATLPGAGPARRRRLWVAAERLPQLLQCCIPHAASQPVDRRAARSMRSEQWTRDEALRELLRARLSAASARSRAATTGRACSASPRADVERRAAGACSSEGYVLQGRFTPGAADERGEWCERHLLARIHRYTLEAPAARDRAGRAARLHALPVRLAARRPRARRSAARKRWPPCWRSWKASRRRPRRGKRELLPARVSDYATAWLDDLCTAGRTLWTRLRPPASDGGSRGRRQRVAARHADRCCCRAATRALWTRLAPPARATNAPSGSRAQRVADSWPRTAPRSSTNSADGTRSAAHRTRGRARRTGRARARPLRQLRRPARAAGAGVEASPTAARRRRRRRRCSASRTPAAGR